MQAVMGSSNKRFTIEQQGDVLEFWAWFINTLHQHLSAGKRNKSTIISKCFQVGLLEPCGTSIALLTVAQGPRLGFVNRV